MFLLTFTGACQKWHYVCFLPRQITLLFFQLGFRMNFETVTAGGQRKNICRLQEV
jgi:hypothetical protein